MRIQRVDRWGVVVFLTLSVIIGALVARAVGVKPNAETISTDVMIVLTATLCALFMR